MLSFPGPIFSKDIAISGRRVTTHWIRGLYAGALFVITAVTLLGQSLSVGGGSAARLQQFQSAAPILTIVLAWFQFIALPVIACVLAGPSISDERRAGTLGTLLTTPLKAWQIVLGKLASVFVQLFILALIALPMLLGLRVFGGVGADAILAVTCLTVSTMLLASVCGVLVSVGSKRTIGAIAVAIVLTGILQFVGPLLLLIIHEYIWRVPQEWTIFCSTPIALVFVVLTMVGERGMPGSGFVLQGWVSASLFTLALSLVGTFAATLMLRESMRHEGDAVGVFSRMFSRVRRIFRRGQRPPDSPAPAPALPAAPARARISREVGDRPVLWRELRQAAISSRTRLYTLLLAMAGFLMLIYLMTRFNEPEMSFPICVIGTVVAFVFAALATAGGIAGESESRSFDVLLSTPLTAREIVRGKYWGAVRRQWIMPAVLASHLFVSSLAGLSHPLMIFYCLALLAGGVLFLAGSGMFFSVLCRRSVHAAVCNLGTAIGIWLVLPLLAILVMELLRPIAFPDDVASVVATANPVALMVIAVDGTLLRGQSTSLGRSSPFDLFGFGSVSAWTFTPVLLLVAGFYAAAGRFLAGRAAVMLALRTQRAL